MLTYFPLLFALSAGYAVQSWPRRGGDIEILAVPMYLPGIGNSSGVSEKFGSASGLVGIHSSFINRLRMMKFEFFTLI